MKYVIVIIPLCFLATGLSQALKADVFTEKKTHIG